MGISDDITPKHSYHRPRSYSNSKKAEEPVADTTTDFVKIQKEQHAREQHSSKIIADASDDFFENNYNRYKAQDTVQKSNNKETNQKAKAVSGWILAILLIGLSAFLVVTNFQKIKHLFNLDTAKTTTNTPVSTDSSLDTYVSEIKPQDYTDPATATTPTTTTAPAATTATTAIFNKAGLKMQVLNGSGVTGSASAIKKILETAGFKIASTGNASNFAYAKTFVYYKTGKEEGANLVKEALKSRVVTVEKSDTKAKTFDIVVVIGKE
jgi:cytoskeletal protein RodZ